MSTNTIVYVTCDKCKCSDHFDGAQIFMSRGGVDLCDECAGDGYTICDNCHRIASMFQDCRCGQGSETAARGPLD